MWIIGMLAVVIALLGVVFLLYKSYAEKNASNPDEKESFLTHMLSQFTPSLSVGEVELALHAQKPITILDVREPSEYAASHIPGAINIPQARIHDAAKTVLTDKHATIYLYCKTDKRSSNATRTLRSMGYKNALNVSGGIDEWQKAGYPLQSNLGQTAQFNQNIS